MHVERIRNQNGVVTTLVRETFREDGKVKKRTVANLSHLPEAIQESVARQLKGEAWVPSSEVFEVVGSKLHGHVEAVLTAFRRLKLEKILGPKSRERELVLAMIAARILNPASKLATSREWVNTTLLSELGVQAATEDQLYAAMDWLYEQQPAIERRLGKRHLEPCGLVLYDLTSSYVEGTQCPLAARGYSRDGKSSKLQVTYGVLTDEWGRPIAVDVYAGNTADPATVQDQLVKMKEAFGLDIVVLVGDRGMLAQTVIDNLADTGGVEWITALKSGALRKLKAEGSFQMGLFDKTHIFEFTSESYPGERLVACRNEALRERRAKKRHDMLEATKKDLDTVRGMVARGTLKGKGEIGIRVGRVINKHKMAKHFHINVEDNVFTYSLKEESIRAESALDGIYVIRTSVPADTIERDDVVRHYKRLTRVERVFRSMKMSGLEVRPIFHRTEKRVRAHIFLCMLSEYVQWHMREAWKSLLFAEETDMLDHRDPVKPAKPTPEVRAKKARKTTECGLPLHSFRTLLGKLASIVRNRCRTPNGSCFEAATQPDPLQRQALALIQTM